MTVSHHDATLVTSGNSYTACAGATGPAIRSSALISYRDRQGWVGSSWIWGVDVEEVVLQGNPRAAAPRIRKDG